MSKSVQAIVVENTADDISTINIPVVDSLAATGVDDGSGANTVFNACKSLMLGEYETVNLVEKTIDFLTDATLGAVPNTAVAGNIWLVEHTTGEFTIPTANSALLPDGSDFLDLETEYSVGEALKNAIEAVVADDDGNLVQVLAIRNIQLSRN